MLSLQFRNLTDTMVTLKSGEQYLPSGLVVGTDIEYTSFDTDACCHTSYRTVKAMPAAIPGVMWIVSPIVFAALRTLRPDVCTPAVDHPDAIRNNKGELISVPGFIRY